MKIFDITINASKTMHPTWERFGTLTQTMLIRAKSKDSLRKLIEDSFEMPLEAIVDDVERDIEIEEYSFDGEERVLASG
jgi:hypothetical protein